MSKETDLNAEDMEVFDMVNRKHGAHQQAVQEDPEWQPPQRFRPSLHLAVVIGSALCAMGGLYIVATQIPDVGFTTGGVFIAAGLSVIGIALACWRWR